MSDITSDEIAPILARLCKGRDDWEILRSARRSSSNDTWFPLAFSYLGVNVSLARNFQKIKKRRQHIDMHILVVETESSVRIPLQASICRDDGSVHSDFIDMVDGILCELVPTVPATPDVILGVLAAMKE